MAKMMISKDTATTGAKTMYPALDYLQTMPADALAAAARGDINLNTLARHELANRGLNRAAKWVGFPEANRLAKQVPVRGANGKTIFVSIPDSEATTDAP